MGSCVSVHKDSDSFTKLSFSVGSKNEKLLIPSPVKEKSVAVNAADRTAAVASLRSPARYSSVGSKDEAFFDSQPWLESDCEDDFMSVNGDFLSSRENTPVHPNSSLVNKLPSEEARDSIAESPPPDKKKRLSDLFKESLREEQCDEAPTTTTLAQQLKSTSGTPDFSGGGSCEQATLDRVGEENKSLRSTQCCLPMLLSSRSMNERRRSSSAHNGG
ncbi:hypothetical protein AAHA92_24278 [Salvia divinorum]|uniref:Uncharacterized protein n=1 Tax=Salvia divinorum TaxID=28513 RepID=A0ABD1G6W4_SALDI